MSEENTVRGVLGAYPEDCQPRRLESLGGGGGFSGASFWRITAPAGRLCLRRWPPEHPTPQRLQYIHAVLRHVQQQGVAGLPCPLETRQGRSFVDCQHHLWELVPWLEGEADRGRVSGPARLVAAMQALARFHAAAASFPSAEAARGPSPALAQRLALLQSLLGGDAQRISAAVSAQHGGELVRLARRLLELFELAVPLVARRLEPATRIVVSLQPCIRDIRREHVLYQGDQVSGLIDFGAMSHECAASDIARLLGSLVQDDANLWRQGLAAYLAVNDLEVETQQLIGVFDQTAVLLSGTNWLRWLYLERRQFEDLQGVQERLNQTLQRLEHLYRHAVRAGSPRR